MNTEEGNKLIMFFDGAESDTIDIMGEIHKCIKYKGSYYPEDRSLKFNEDWNLLMPVVKSIHGIVNKKHKVSDKEAWLWCRIMDAIVAVDILETHSFVTKFIRWHNSQPQNPTDNRQTEK